MGHYAPLTGSVNSIWFLFYLRGWQWAVASCFRPVVWEPVAGEIWNRGRSAAVRSSWWKRFARPPLPSRTSLPLCRRGSSACPLFARLTLPGRPLQITAQNTIYFKLFQFQEEIRWLYSTLSVPRNHGTAYSMLLTIRGSSLFGVIFQSLSKKCCFLFEW